jgi:hypothetical protein
MDDGRNENSGKHGQLSRRKISEILVPGVADGGMGVRDVKRIGAGNDAFDDTVGAGDDELKFSQVEELCGQGKKRKIRTVMSLQEGQPLKKARPDQSLFDFRSLAPRKMKERIDGSPGENLGQDFEDFFSPSPAGQPVMDEGNPDILHLS